MNEQLLTVNLKRYFIETYGTQIVDIVCKSALGIEDLPLSASGTRLSDAWKLLSDMLLAAPELQALSIRSSDDIEAALEAGKITIAEMETLMKSLRVKNEADYLPKIHEDLQKMGK